MEKHLQMLCRSKARWVHMRRKGAAVKEKCFIKETVHYGLCQWEAEDRILREDFNGDNAKIDAAIAAANPLRDLGQAALEADAAELNLDLSAVDWSQYWEVRVYFSLAGTDNGSVSVLLNHAGSGYSNELGNSSNWLARFSLSLNPVQGCVRLYRNGTAVGAVVEAAASGSVVTQSYYSGGGLQSLDFVFDRPMKAGSRAWVCGVKR